MDKLQTIGTARSCRDICNGTTYAVAAAPQAWQSLGHNASRPLLVPGRWKGYHFKPKADDVMIVSPAK